MGTRTFSQHIADRQKGFPEARGEFTALLQEIMVAAKVISREVRKAGLIDALGLTGRMNIQGEAVQILDEFANETIIRNVGHTGHLCVLSSEENAEPIPIPDQYPRGGYVMTFDPLDGSSNIDGNVSIGTIFSIHRKRSSGTDGTLEDLLQAGRDQVAAGYIIYGSSTILVYSTGRGQGVHGFTLDPTVGEFLLSHPDIRIPTDGRIYSVNEGNTGRWDEKTRKVVAGLKGSDNPRGEPYSTRYIGSLVADFHRNLLYGGIFLYPPDAKHPTGKLRLLSEAAPMSFLAEEAGGKATTGRERVLDVVPKELHERVPLIVGSPREVEWAERILAS
ncbi:MAG: class 1 fructose-bisphosphatase [Candidatus Eisenbacteria bacterium]|nr:class 1 fructose-bisphosphatase [Candidatus Latescibacterota bacterium]MBD3301913.1 class 1 fructose-bisphosphatase [Candidatus Eisenbacteria bacterium]